MKVNLAGAGSALNTHAGLPELLEPLEQGVLAADRVGIRGLVRREDEARVSLDERKDPARSTRRPRRLARSSDAGSAGELLHVLEHAVRSRAEIARRPHLHARRHGHVCAHHRDAACDLSGEVVIPVVHDVPSSRPPPPQHPRSPSPRRAPATRAGRGYSKPWRPRRPSCRS